MTVPSTELVQFEGVLEIVRAYERARDDVRAGFALVARAEETLNKAYKLGDHLTLSVTDPHSGRAPNWEEPDAAMERLNRQVWRALLERLDLRRLMSRKRWTTVTDQVERGEMPEISEASVTAFAKNILASVDEMVEEAVVEVFDLLRPRRSAYKTNTEFEVGERVILDGYVRVGYRSAFCVSFDSYYSQGLTALENVFQVLDGGNSVNRSHRSELQDAIEASDDGTGQTRYFEFRCFRKGTLHLKMKRPDLVQKLNTVAGGARLRGEVRQ